MKLIFIRHGDPDYSIDSLTEKGFREAEMLSKLTAKWDVDHFYVSPLGRAKDTAAFTLNKMGRTAEELDWLVEFRGTCIRPDMGKEMICWDFLPRDWTKEPLFYDKDRWTEAEVFRGTNVKAESDYVIRSFDEFLAGHGYVREGMTYRAVSPNKETLVFFCHFGVTCLLAAHLLGMSPMVAWHGFVGAPTGVTTFCTEERREGIASFRMSAYGDISHLNMAGEPPAFAARYCEVFTDPDRH